MQQTFKVLPEQFCLQRRLFLHLPFFTKLLGLSSMQVEVDNHPGFGAELALRFFEPCFFCCSLASRKFPHPLSIFSYSAVSEIAPHLIKPGNLKFSARLYGDLRSLSIASGKTTHFHFYPIAVASFLQPKSLPASVSFFIILKYLQIDF